MLQHLKKTRHKPLIGFVSVCLCALIVLLSLGIQSALADDSLPEQPATTVPIATSQDLINYADEYARGGHNPNDTLQLALSEGSSFVLSAEDGFHGIGTANRPFNGKVEIVDNAVNRFITDQPLFGGITTDAVIVNASDAVRQIEISRLSESDSPLFAAVVKKGATTNSAAWDVCLKADDRDVVNQTAYGFAGVIGTVEEECVLSLDFTHDSVSAAGTPADAKSAGDLGLICNTLGEGAELTFTVTLGSSMSGKTFNVASTGGHAGGAVGVMSDNATLKTGAAYTSYANVSTTGDSKFAGGLVGYATDAALDTTAGTVTLAKSVSGKRGAGGLYGYYESTLASRTFDLEDLTTTSAFTLAGGTDVGILAGTLVAEGNVTVTETGANLGDDTFNQQVKFTGGTNRGGLIGAYENNNLDHILYIHQAKIKVVSGTASGGAVGKFGGSQPVYAKVEYFHLDNDSSGNVDGGLVGNAGTNGSFIDVYHDVIIEGNVGSGLVGTLTTLNSDVGERVGVLRLSGTVDLSAATCATAQLVGTRGNALVYALGSGSDANWTFKRGSSKVDDIGDWGEVVRLGSTSGLSESDLFTAVDTSTHHTITLASYADSMGTLADFVKTALNIQLNGGVNTGALRFAGSARGTILADDLSLTANIDLRNSGILALTRDNGANPAFTGSLNGNSKTVTLAIGEPYGQDSSGNPLTTVGDNNSGTIIGNAGHGYLGLFAKVKDASVSNLTVNGYISACAGKKTSAYRVGGVAASVVSGSTSAPLTLSHVTTAQDIKFYTITSDAALKVYLGGAVGCVEEGVAGTIAVSHSNFINAITEKLRAALHTEGIGGAIGHVNSVAALTLDFDDISLGGTFNNTVSGSNSYNDVRYGGLIGTIVGNSGSFTRNVTIHDLTVANTVSITTKTNGSDRATLAGTFLGSEWLDTNVTIGTLGSTDGVTLSGPSLTVSSDNTPNMAALVAKATGHWTVNHVQVNSATIKANNAATFGFLVGDGIAGSSALYLDLISDGFHIGSTTLTGTFNVYDEVVGYAVVSGKQIEDNGNAVVSIRTAGGAPLIMTGAGCNTYQNQITSGTKPDTNSNTRYYYNLDVIRAKQEHSAASDGEKLLLWSLNKYANTAIRGNGNGYFSDTFSNYLSGNSNKNCDMAGLSYYPVDASDVTIRNLSVKFYNQEIEDGESGTGNSDGVARSTRTQRTQHYMMHEGIFRDYTGDLTVNGLHLAGNVSNQHGGSASGFLVCGTMGGTNDTDSVTISNLVLDGAQVQRSGTYGPLLIHKIGKNVTFSLAHVSATAGASGDAYPNTNTAAVASSLIGDVGNDTATNINLTFSDIALDARTTSGANTPYGTTRSIFDRATLLNSFRFLSGSLGEYNYNYNEDWPTNHRVTYGKEVSESVEFAGRESHYYDYYGAGDHFTDPTGSCAAAYNFSSGWLRYVWQPYTDGSDLYHEIKVNVMDISLTAGCGQYNDPYRIDNGDMLATVANIISGKPDDGVVVCLPTDIGGNYDMWCTNRTAHTDYVYNNATNHKRFELVSDPNTYVSTDTVREYLAGAYYSITAAQIELPAGYVGLGYQAPSTWDSANYDCAFAFRGVIVGANDGNSHTILNHSYNPLIKSANGCVVKDVTVATDATITINQANSVAFRYDSDGCASYGAVIGQVMGGDNLLDHVAVDFTSATFTESSNALKRLEPVGGYVGVVVNGGLVFRNMSGLTATGLTAAKCSYVSDAGWLYVNPIVGRVVAGYVFNEVPGGYAASSATLHNGTKNYDIPDLDPNLTMLNVTASAQDNHVVTAPNAQALYVLSCIVNSGAGSATWKASTEQSYAALSGSTWSGWRNTCATHCADYDEVGPSAASDGDYATVAAQDKYSNSSGTNASIPYIIRKYTQKDGSMYRARSLCGSSTVASITLSGGTYNMPGGFRGIGSIYRSSNSLRIQFKQLIGSNTNLHLAMNYQEYNHESGEKDSKTNLLIENVKPYEGAGFGLFNAVYLSGFDANSDTNSVKDLTLSGSVFYDIRKVADFNNYGAAAYPNLTSALMKQAGDSILYAYGWSSYVKDKVEQTAFYPDPADRLEAKTILHVGGVAGVSSTNGLYLKNVTLSNLSVEGAKYVGGAVGFSTKAIVIDAPSASGLSVTAGFAAGGLVGGFSSNAASGKATTANANLTIKGASANSPAVIDQSNVQVKGYPSAARIIFNNGSDFAYMFHCAGGLVGYACTGTGNTVTVQNVTVSGGAISALHADFRPNDMRYKIIAGGLFGRLEKSGVLFENVTVYGVDIFANESGGLIGVSRDALNGSMTNIVVDGGDVNLTKKIDGTNIAGGLIAFHSENASLDLTLDNILVANYTITSSHNNAEKAGAGGLVGALRTGGTRFNIINSVIRNVKVSRGSTNNDNAQNDNGLGGVFGALTNNHTIVRGHNLLIDGVILEKRGGSYNPGMLVGNNNSHNIKFVGVSIQGGSSATVPVVATGNYGTSGYVVMADYDGDCKTDEKNTAWRTIYNSNGNPVANTNELAAAAPYVTVNDAGNVGSSGLFLTGDGIAPTVADLPIQEIRGNSVIDKRYAYANNYRTACNLSKLSTYNYEQNTTLTDDFAVLIVDDVSRINTTNLINAYLNLLAGTNEDYTANKSNVYAVDLYKMSWNEGQGRFVISASGNTNTNLKRSNGQFYMDINSVDTGNNTFTLIDVKFYDPNATTKVAYHLYVPVLVKKMLTFDFEIATGNGTNYQRAWYDDRFGKPIMENLGTPATIFFKYTYQRTQDEWQNAINGGENVQSRNFTKTLTLTKQDAINDLPSDTLLVLVDVNRGGKPYYATFGSAYNAATGTLSLSAFHENLGDNTSATAFTPVSLGALLCQGETQGLTATQANDGGLMITDEAHATVKAYLGGVETYFRAATDGTNEADRYTVSVAKTDGADGYIPLEEAYYISFFTDATTSNNVYHYTISAPVSFNDPSNPSRIADPDKLQNHEGTVHMILGNIFVQTGVSLTTTPNNTEMSVLTGNHVVTATMGATVTIHADLKSEVQGYLGANSGINVFHSFLLQLTRNDETSSRKIITGSPAVDGTYVIASANGDVAATDPADQVITVTNGYAEIHSSNLTQNINEYLVGGNGAVISATLSLNYGTDAAISAQFPSREDTTNVSVGTKATCSSNLAYDRANTASSKVAQGAADSADHSYYCRIDNRRASLSYNVKSDVFLGDYGPLGINPLAEDAVDEMPVSTLAVYDISEIVTPATGYDLVRVRVRLHQRVDNYAADLALSTYMTEVSVKGYDNDTVRNTDSTTEYVFTLPRAALASNSAVATALEIPLNYKVLTGATFEAAGLTYSNYKISLSVELTKSSNTADVLDVSLATDYLVYTNARVLPDYVEIVSP